jgi:hypothetical protein
MIYHIALPIERCGERSSEDWFGCGQPSSGIE